MKMKHFLWKVGVLSACAAFLAACGGDEKNLPTPFTLESSRCEVMYNGTDQIRVSGGSGDFSVSVADERVVTATYAGYYGTDYTGVVSLSGVNKGTTTLTLTDNRTGEAQAVEVKVTDAYVMFRVMESNHPALQPDVMVYMVNNEAKDCYFYLPDPDAEQERRFLAKGSYGFSVEVVPCLTLRYASDSEGHFAEASALLEAHPFRFDMESEATNAEVLNHLQHHLGVDWTALAGKAVKSDVARPGLYLRMTVDGTDYVVLGGFIPNQRMPHGVLN